MIIGIAAVDRKNAIGKGGKLPWHYSSDMKFFRETTTGHAVVMGRKTWLTIGKPLKNRLNIVLSRDSSIEPQESLLVLTDIYAAGEAPRPGVTGRLLLDAVQQADPSAAPRWCPTLDDVVDLLAEELRPGDLCLSLGAGDVTTLADRLLPRLQAREGAEGRAGS